MGTLSNGVSYYDYRKAEKRSGHHSEFREETLVYAFKSPKTSAKYIVEVEHYNLHLYAIKFYLKKDQNNPNRFNLLSGLNEVRPVIYTCIAIMLDIFRHDETASFAFIGSPSHKEIEREAENPRLKKENNTQRYRIYSMIMSTFFSEERFSHHHSNKCSLYLMRNKSSNASPKEMQEMINIIYNIDIQDLV
ncbi:hypothetical protein [Butyricimonas faecihominis]|mgnify:CR=1 FL=1|uniref:hypothetical protein n=1 Tax=Butyricimonas faecihominis TaxID=1472416 RepID=UPI0026DC2D57|nr:hypothetical protein [Butyricimonas faecihominis]